MMGPALTESILRAIAGGALIGLAASAMLYFVGRIAGISGIIGGLLTPQRGDIAWRAAFAGGLLAGGALLLLWIPGVFGVPTVGVDGRLFWGLDALPMVAACLRGDPWFAGGAWETAAAARPGVVRQG